MATTYQPLASDLLAAIAAHLKRQGIALRGETGEMFVALISPKVRDLCALVQELEG